jgi:chromosome segregation ATPase
MHANDQIDAEIVQRITDAADQLFAESGRGTAPSVDAVRRRARANMNHASLVMREWRRKLKAQPAPTEEAMPESMRHLGNQMTLNVWREANKIAVGQLVDAKAAWQEERAELEEFRHQLSMAFDVQLGEMEQARHTISNLQAELANHVTTAATLEQRAVQAETSNIGADKVLRHAQEEIKELHSLLRASQASQEQLARQLQQHLASQIETAQRNLAEQTCLSEQLGQLRQEAEQLRAQLTPPHTLPTTSVAGRNRKKMPGQDLTERVKPPNHEGE